MLTASAAKKLNNCFNTLLILPTLRLFQSAELFIFGCLFYSLFRYYAANIKCLDTVRAYHTAVPDFLRNRPRRFVEHCMKRLISAETFKFITTLKDNVYAVKSDDSTYTVHTSGTMPSCECPDWYRHGLPCKHLLAVIVNVEGLSWSVLPQAYRDFPLFTLDEDVVGNSRRHCYADASLSSATGTHDVSNLLSHFTTAEVVDELLPCYEDQPTCSTDTTDLVTNQKSTSAQLKLQSRIRQMLSTISSYTDNIANEAVLDMIAADIQSVVTTCKASVSNKNATMFRRETRKRIGKKHALGSIFIRRLRYIRDRKRRKQLLAKQST